MSDRNFTRTTIVKFCSSYKQAPRSTWQLHNIVAFPGQRYIAYQPPFCESNRKYTNYTRSKLYRYDITLWKSNSNEETRRAVKERHSLADPLSNYAGVCYPPPILIFPPPGTAAAVAVSVVVDTRGNSLDGWTIALSIQHATLPQLAFSYVCVKEPFFFLLSRKANLWITGYPLRGVSELCGCKFVLTVYLERRRRAEKKKKHTQCFV